MTWKWTIWWLQSTMSIKRRFSMKRNQNKAVSKYPFLSLFIYRRLYVNNKNVAKIHLFWVHFQCFPPIWLTDINYVPICLTAWPALANLTQCETWAPPIWPSVKIAWANLTIWLRLVKIQVWGDVICIRIRITVLFFVSIGSLSLTFYPMCMFKALFIQYS